LGLFKVDFQVKITGPATLGLSHSSKPELGSILGSRRDLDPQPLYLSIPLE
jgi:hypothetical protein